MFRTSILVRFGDLDPAGIVYYPNLAHFLHVSFEDFCAGQLGKPYPEIYREGIGFPTVKLEMEFLSPIRYGDSVEVEMAVEHVGQTSVRLRYKASVASRPVFTARNTAVAVDMATFRPMTLPAWLRGRFEAALDPAG